MTNADPTLTVRRILRPPLLIAFLAGLTIGLPCGYLLKRNGSSAVAPAAQATNVRESDGEDRAVLAAMRELLLAAAAAPKGIIEQTESSSGIRLSVGATTLTNDSLSPREAARWRSAIDALDKDELIEQAAHRTSQNGTAAGIRYVQWRLTAKGYALADGVKSNNLKFTNP